MVISAAAGNVTLTTGDTVGTSSFNSAGNWSNGSAPEAGNAYFDAQPEPGLRSPADGNDYTFQGDSLTLTNGWFVLKGNNSAGDGNVITVPNLIMVNGGGVGDYANINQTLAGQITLGTGGGKFDPQTGNGGAFSFYVSATITGSGPLLVSSAGGNDGGTLVLEGTNYYTGGTVLVTNDTLLLDNDYALGSTNGTLTVDSGTLDLWGTYPAVGNFTGVAGSIVNNDPFGSAVVLTIGSGNNGGGDFLGTIADTVTGSGTVGITKIGSGIITLSGGNVYSGDTTVNGGTLAVNGSLNSGGNVYVASGATLTGAGSVGQVTVDDGGAIGGSTNGAASLNMQSLTFNNTASLTVSSETPLQGGNVTANGAAASAIINVLNSTTWSSGTYTLMTYSGSLGGTGTAAFALGTVQNLTPRQFATLNDTGTELDLVITGGDSPVWTGALNGLWTTNILASPKNWNLLLAGTPTDYEDGDVVLFDDSATGVTAVSISTTNVWPASVTFNNEVQTYSVSGPYGIAGATGVTLSNGGTVSLNNSNSYAGPTTVNAGTLVINGALSSVSPVAVAGGATLAGAGSVGNVTVASGGIIQAGSNYIGNFKSLSLTFSGTATVNVGSAALVQTGNLLPEGGAGSVTINVTNSGSWTPGLYTLISYSGSLGGSGSSAFTLGTVYPSLTGSASATLVTNGTSISVFIGGDFPEWTGDLNGTWSTNVLANPKNWRFLYAGTPTDFINNESVFFDDTAAGTKVVNISMANVAPQLTIFSNTVASTYTLTGPFGITGSSSLIKANTGTVTIANTNAYSGSTILNGGTLRMGAPNNMPNGSGKGSLLFSPASGTATFDLGGFNQTVNSFTNVSLGGTSVVDNTGGAATLSIGIPTVATTGVFSGLVTNSGGPLALTTLGPTTSQTLAGNATFSGGLNLGVNINSATSGGSLIVSNGASLSVGNGSSNVWIGLGTITESTAYSSIGSLILSNASSFVANVGTFKVGAELDTPIGSGEWASVGTLNLATNNIITAATSVVFGDSTGSGGCSGTVTTPNNSITTINTPLLTVGGNKAAGTFTLGTGATLAVAGNNGTRAVLGVANYAGPATIQTGTSFTSALNLSGGSFTGLLSSVTIGQCNNNKTGTSTGTVTLSPSTSNHVDINGPGSVVIIGEWVNTGTSSGNGVGTLTIGGLDGASAITSSNNSVAILIASTPTSSRASGTLNLYGGTLTITTTNSAIAGGGGTSALSMSGVTLAAGASSPVFISGLTTASISTNGVTFNTGTNNITIPQPLIHAGALGSTADGGLVKLGSGILALTGTNTFTGPLIVRAGTLAGTGRILSPVTVQNAGTLSAGNGAIGILTISNSLSLAGTTRLKLNASTLTNDVIQGVSTLTYGGTLSLTNLAGTLAGGQSFKLFNATSYAGAFATIVPATPGTSLAWNTNSLTNGVLSVVSAAPLAFATPVVTTSGLVLSGVGGTPGGLYTILTTTNVSLPIAQWTPVVTNSFNANGEFSFTNAIDSGAAAAFYTIENP